MSTATFPTVLPFLGPAPLHLGLHWFTACKILMTTCMVEGVPVLPTALMQKSKAFSCRRSVNVSEQTSTEANLPVAVGRLEVTQVGCIHQEERGPGIRTWVAPDLGNRCSSNKPWHCVLPSSIFRPDPEISTWGEERGGKGGRKSQKWNTAKGDKEQRNVWGCTDCLGMQCG